MCVWSVLKVCSESVSEVFLEVFLRCTKVYWDVLGVD